jgi:site-specific recombinase XerD
MEPRLLDRVRSAVRTRHYSRRTEEAYASWTKRFILFHHKRHPAAMGAEEVNAFLSHLAVEEKVCASTQAQALCALVFLYRHVLGDPLPWIDDIIRARRHRKLPIVLTRDEVRELLAVMRDAASGRCDPVWRGSAAPRGPSTARQGRRFCGAAVGRSRGQGRKGSADDAAGQSA